MNLLTKDVEMYIRCDRSDGKLLRVTAIFHRPCDAEALAHIGRTGDTPVAMTDDVMVMASKYDDGLQLWEAR